MSTPLGEKIRAMIEAEGPIDVERYMWLCLQHPTHGYYTTRESIGGAGDFITAPEVSQMFGELIGVWMARVWMDLDAPHGVRLVELGPGRGTLMDDALRATRVVPGFPEAIRVDLVETSPHLEALQRAKLDGAAPQIQWWRGIEDLPEGPAIIVANEFFDALPVRHYVRGDTGWHERMVGLDASRTLIFGAAREMVDVAARSGAPGQILEVGHAGFAAMATLASRVATTGGAMLVLDYGHAETSLGETLQALRGHAHADVLATPGEADLTTHVDFAALARAARAAGARVHGPVEQGVFLRRLGIDTRAARLKRDADPGQADAIDAALARLTAPESSMATLFKVMAITAPDASPPPGFEETSA